MFVKVLKKSFWISLFLISIVITLCITNEFLNEDIFDGISVIFISFFIASFCGLYISKIKIIVPLGIPISAIITFILIHFFDFILFDYLFFKGTILNHSINNLSIFGVFISILTYLYGFFEKSNQVKPIDSLKYPFLKAFIFTLSIIIVYSIIFGFSFSTSFIDNVRFFFRILLLPAIVLYFLSIFIFNFIYKNYQNKKWLILIIYLTVFIFYLSSCYLKYSQLSGAMNIQNFLTYLVARVPFAFMIVLCVQISYLLEINKQEKTFLSQQSLESQLNYQQLKNQISPHFLFNNINVLTSLIEENPKKAVLFSENLSNIYRYFLDQEKQDVVLVKDEIEFAKSYLELLKDRFEVGLNFSIDIDEKAKGKYIVSTILQQVLENVVKHNTINEDNIVNIKISSKENYLIVENNKIPKLINEESSKKGIENIKKRITFFTDEKVIIESTTEVYKIQLPILETIQ
jgi:two-component system LytT family sensor kinase